MSRQKSEWSKKVEELQGQLPKGFDARGFKGCRIDGKWDKAKIISVCEEKGFKDKADVVVTFLSHMDNKPDIKSRKSGSKKPVVKIQSETNLLSKRTYADLSASDIGKLVALLTELQENRKEQYVADLKAQKEKIEKQLKELGSK